MRAVAAAALLVAGGLAAGCGGGPATGEVSGTVSYDGKPVEIGAIAFYPADGNGPATGGAITDGTYTVAKVPAGTARVVITGAKDVKEQKMSYENKASVVKTSSELLPPKYSDEKATELRYDVKPGAQTKDFDLPK